MIVSARLKLAFVIALLFKCFIACSLALAEEQSSFAVEKVSRLLVEEEIKPDYKQAVDDFTKKLAAQGKSMDEETRHSLQYIFYNKAYTWFVCTKEALTRLEVNNFEMLTDKQMQERIKTSREICLKPKNVGFQVTITWLEDYGKRPIFREKVVRCEIGARNIAAEISFPPFIYLDTPKLQLFDYEKFAACLQQ